MQSKIVCSGEFATAGLYNANSGTPTVAPPLHSDAALLLSDFSFADPTALGASAWHQRTDGAWLIANALEHAVRHKPCPGDLNGDGQVDDADFVLLADYYNALVDPRGDLNGDGLTDDADFVIFAGAYDTLLCP